MVFWQKANTNINNKITNCIVLGNVIKYDVNKHNFHFMQISHVLVHIYYSIIETICVIWLRNFFYKLD